MIGRAYFITVQNAELRWSYHAICQFVQCSTISRTSLFFVNCHWNFGTSEPGSSNRRAKQRFVNIPSAVIDFVYKTYQREDRMNFLGRFSSLVRLQAYCANNTANTHIVYIANKCLKRRMNKNKFVRCSCRFQRNVHSTR